MNEAKNIDYDALVQFIATPSAVFSLRKLIPAEGSQFLIYRTRCDQAGSGTDEAQAP